MNAPANRGFRKGIRTLIQTIAGGGLTALVTVLADGLSPEVSIILMAVFTAITAFAQNWLETAGKIGTLLPSPGLVVGPDVVVATVEAVATEAGDIVGDVTDTAGDVVGTVLGAVVPEEEHGGIIATLALFVAIILLVTACFALLGDDEEESSHRGGDGSGECSGSDGSCSDDDLSPRFEDSPIIICLRPDSCRFA